MNRCYFWIAVSLFSMVLTGGECFALAGHLEKLFSLKSLVCVSIMGTSIVLLILNSLILFLDMAKSRKIIAIKRNAA